MLMKAYLICFFVKYLSCLNKLLQKKPSSLQRWTINTLLTWTLLILTKCPSCWTISLRSKGWPSLSQVRVGGGTPVAEHSSSRGLFTAMVSSSGELELVIFGGSGDEIRRFWPYCWLQSLSWKYRFLRHYQARWGWRFLCYFQPDYWPRSYRGQHLRGQHLAAGVVSPVHPIAGYGAETAAGHPLTKWVWEEEHPGLHRIVSLRTPGLL